MKLLICTQVVDKNHPILGFFCGWVAAFAQHFAEVHVICLQKGTYILPSNVYVYSLGKEEGENKIKYLFRFYKHFGHIFFRVRVDYVFFHMGAIYNILAAPFFLIRTLYTTKFYWWKAHGHINAVGKCALLFVDRVYTSTASGFAVDTTKRHIVGQAIDTSLFVLPNAETERKKEIIFVGRIMPVKRIEDFIDVAQILIAEDTTLSFTVIGPVGDEAYFQKMQEKCRIASLENHLQFIGAKTQTELVTIYQEARIFLNTSITQSMDKTVLEALLCGCIPVTSNRAFAELLQADGLYIEHASAKQYATVIQSVLHDSQTPLRQKLRDRVIAQHSLMTFFERIFNV